MNQPSVDGGLSFGHKYVAGAIVLVLVSMLAFSITIVSSGLVNPEDEFQVIILPFAVTIPHFGVALGAFLSVGPPAPLSRNQTVAALAVATLWAVVMVLIIALPVLFESIKYGLPTIERLYTYLGGAGGLPFGGVVAYIFSQK